MNLNIFYSIKKSILFIVLNLFALTLFSQSFEVVKSELFDDRIGDILFITESGIVLYGFGDGNPDDASIYLTAYNSKGKILYYRKKLNISEIKKPGYIFTNMNFNINDGIVQEKNKNIFIPLNTNRQGQFLLEIDPEKGSVIKEEKISWGPLFYKNNYNKARDKYIKFTGNDKITKIELYDNKHKLLKSINFDDFFSGEEITVFDCILEDETLFFTSNNSKLKKFYLTKCNFQDKKWEHVLLLDFSDENKEAGISPQTIKMLNNDVNNNFLTIIFDEIEKKKKTETVFLNIEKSNISKTKKNYMITNKVYDYSTNNCDYSFPEKTNVCKSSIDKQGNVFSIIEEKNDYPDNIFGISVNKTNGEEIFGYAYRFFYAQSIIRPKKIIIGHGKQSTLVFFNNYEKNFMLPENKKPKNFGSYKGCKAIAIEIKNNGEIIKHDLFGQLKESDKNMTLNIESVYYDELNNCIYSTYENGYKYGFVKIVLK